MLRGAEPPPLRDQVAGLIDAGKAYARAEVTYYKRLATSRAKAAAAGIGFALVALLFVQAALTVLLVALALWIARAIGLAGGFAVAGIVALAVAGALAAIGVRRITSAGAEP